MATTTQITYAYDSKNSKYLTPIPFNGVALGMVNGGDKYVSPTIIAASNFEVGSTYYLKFTTRSMRASDYIVDVLLTSNQPELSAKLLKSITIPGLGTKGNNTNELTTYMNEFLFSPSDPGYNRICLSLRQDQVEQFKSPVKDLNKLIFQNAVTDYIQIEGDQKLVQGKMRIGKTDDANAELKLLFKDGDNIQEVFVIQNNETKKLTLQYGKEEINIDFSSSASPPVALIDNSVESPTETNWILQKIGEDEQYIGDWLPVYYFTNNNLERDWALKNIKLAKVQNIINPPKATDVKEISKVGLQARPNTMFMIDGQEFRMGASGLYQIEYPDLKISSIGIVPPVDEKIYTDTDKEIALNFFILDYRYDKKSS